MARSMPTPWLFNALNDTFREDSEVAHANLQNKKWPPKMVQVVSYNLKLNSLVVSDKDHMITVFLTQKCFDEVSDQHSLASLKYSQVKLANFHFSTVLQSAGHFDLALLHSQKVIFPLAIQCAKLTYMGGNDLELMGDPVDVNKDSRIQKILGSLKYHDMVKKLVSRQYNVEADVVGRLPIHDGGQLLLERYSEENIPQLSHAEVPEDLLAILEERRSALRAQAAAAQPTLPVAPSSSSSSSASNAVAAAVPLATGAPVAAVASGVVEADSLTDSQLLYGDSQEGEEGKEDVVYVGERDSQMIVVTEEGRNSSGSSSSSSGAAANRVPVAAAVSTPARRQPEEARLTSSLLERLTTPAAVAAASSQGSSSSSSSSSQSSSVTPTPGSTDPRRQTVVDLTQADSQQLHQYLSSRYQTTQSSQSPWVTSPLLSAAGVTATPATVTTTAPSAAAAAAAPLPMLPPSSSSSLPLYVKSPLRNTTPAGGTVVASNSGSSNSSSSSSGNIVIHPLVGRKTLQKVGRHVFRGVIVGHSTTPDNGAASQFVVQYEGEGDTDTLSEEDVLRILVPEEQQPRAVVGEAGQPTQSQVVSSSTAVVAAAVVGDVEEVCTQPQYPSAVVSGGAAVVSMGGEEEDQFMNMLRRLDEGEKKSSGDDGKGAAAAAVTNTTATPTAVVVSESKKMLDDLQAFISRVNKRKADPPSTLLTAPLVTTATTTVDSEASGSNSKRVKMDNSGSGRQSLNSFVQFLFKHGL